MDHLRDNGFTVKPTDVAQKQLNELKDIHHVPPRLQACHTGVIGDYVIEGHVPSRVIVRLLKEKPNVYGLAVPGMPVGSPGMEGPSPKPYDVFTFDKEGRIHVYERIEPIR